MLNIKEQKIVAQEQNYKWDEVHIVGGKEGQISALVTYVVTNEKGERLDTIRIDYKGEDFNTFWENFNSGKFLYEELAAKKELEVTVSDAVEAEFANEITKQITK